MAKTLLTIKVKGDLKGQISKELSTKIGRAAREVIVVMQPVVEKAVDSAINENADDYIPTDEEAYELGIGSDGAIDRDRTENAYRAMLTSSNNGVTTTSTKAYPGAGIGRVGNIRAVVNYQALFKTDLATVLGTNTKDTEEELIPWMQWLLEGEIIQGWTFEDRVTQAISRTGGGIMKPYGLWQFAPARVGYEERMDESMIRKISAVAEEAIQDGINSVR